jgi:hypothetical protein
MEADPFLPAERLGSVSPPALDFVEAAHPSQAVQSSVPLDGDDLIVGDTAYDLSATGSYRWSVVGSSRVTTAPPREAETHAPSEHPRRQPDDRRVVLPSVLSSGDQQGNDGVMHGHSGLACHRLVGDELPEANPLAPHHCPAEFRPRCDRRAALERVVGRRNGHQMTSSAPFTARFPYRTFGSGGSTPTRARFHRVGVLRFVLGT